MVFIVLSKGAVLDLGMHYIYFFCHEKISANITDLFSMKTIKYIGLNSQKEVAYCISWAVGKEAMDTPEQNLH